MRRRATKSAAHGRLWRVMPTTGPDDALVGLLTPTATSGRHPAVRTWTSGPMQELAVTRAGPDVQEVLVVSRPNHTVRGHSVGLTIPSSTPKFQGPNFGVAGWTVDHCRIWWAWHRSPQVISPTTVPAWGGTIAFGLFETGTTILGPESSPNATQWIDWAPVTSIDERHTPVWYDAGGTAASREWGLNGTYVETKTSRTAPGNGMDLWCCWDIPLTPAGTDRFSWAWVIQYKSL